MTRTLRRVVIALIAAPAVALPATAARGADWQPAQPPPPPGFPYGGALGHPGDLRFWAPNRGLLTIAGNGAYQQGVLVYDGTGWRQYATVCGSDGGNGGEARIAWAGPDEFWTIARPNPLQGPTIDGAVTLCRFKDGAVAGSYASALSSNERFAPLDAAACRGPGDCLFGGIASTTVDQARSGTFHLRWDGSALHAVYAPQGRAVTDILPTADGYLESATVGPRPLVPTPATPATDEPVPKLLQRVTSGAFTTDPFEPIASDELPLDGSELLAVDDAGQGTWAGGGQATSGPDKLLYDGGRPPLLAYRPAGGATFAELPLPDGAFAAGDSIVDIAAVPGTTTAWAAIAQYPPQNDQRARVALIDSTGAVLRNIVLPAGGAPLGAADRIACPARDDCWMVTVGGWLFHLTDGTAPARDTDPAFGGLITTRPNDARSPQFTPDALPVDDSQLHAPPPVPAAEPPATAAKAKRLPALLKILGSHLRRGSTTYELRIRLARRASVALLAERREHRGRRLTTVVVARTRARTLKPGIHALHLRFSRRRWPTRLRFVLKDLDPRVRKQLASQAPQNAQATTLAVTAERRR